MSTSAQGTETPVVTHALQAYSLGFTPICLKPNDKMPDGPWRDVAYTDRDSIRQAFSDPNQNLGVALGTPSGGLVDVDIDNDRALLIADIFLGGSTLAVSGRTSRPRSHYWYRVEDDLPSGTRQWKHPSGKVLVEIRSTGGQTALPPSIHPSGERYRWDGSPWGGDRPAVISGTDLDQRVGLLAIATLLAVEWPDEGGRHAAYLALAGALLGEGYGEHRRVSKFWDSNNLTEAVLTAVAVASHDEAGPEQRVEEVLESTRRKIATGQQTQGWPALAEQIDEKVVKRVRDFVFAVEQAEGYVRAQDFEDSFSRVEDGPAHEHTSDDLNDRQNDAGEVVTDIVAESRFEFAVEQRIFDFEVNDEARRRKREREQEGQPVAPIRLGHLVLNEAPPEPPRVTGFGGEGTLMPWDASTLLVAQRKTGKTTFLANLARSLLTGEKFLGAFDVRPLDPGSRLALLNYEMNPRHMAGWLHERGVPMERVVQIDLRGYMNPFRDEKRLNEMGETLKEYNVETVFVDTFGQAFTGDSQNDAAQVSPWLNDLNRWVRKVVGARDLVLTAHAGWSGNRSRGSSAIEDWADSIVHLSRKDKDDVRSPRTMQATGRDVDLEEGDLAFDPATHEVTFHEAQKTVQTNASGGVVISLQAEAHAEDAVRLALNDASGAMKKADLIEAAKLTEHGPGVSKRLIGKALERLILNNEVIAQQYGASLLHTLNPDYEQPTEDA